MLFHTVLISLFLLCNGQLFAHNHPIFNNSSVQVVANFECNEEESPVEFRYFDGQKFTPSKILSMRTNVQGRLWYASFGELFNRIETMRNRFEIDRAHHFFGEFRHKSFSGKSYVFDMNQESRNTLEDLLKPHALFSIWDFVSCKKAKFNLIRYGGFSYKLHLKSLESCVVQYD